MIARAEALHSLTIRARYEVGTFEKLDFKDAHFDRVFSMEALYYASDLARRDRASASACSSPAAAIETLVDYYAGEPRSEPWAKVMGLAAPSPERGRLEGAPSSSAGFTGIDRRA
jgi:hypothetical protein